MVDREFTLLITNSADSIAETGVITYTKGQGPIFSTHPVEKPYCKCCFIQGETRADRRVIFQIGSSDPELALQAAKIVQQDVAGMYVSSLLVSVYNADM